MKALPANATTDLPIPTAERRAAAPLRMIGALDGRVARIALALTGWTLLAAIPTTSAYIAASGEDLNLWFRFFRPIVLYYYIWAICTPLIYLMVMRLPFTPLRAPWTILSHLAVLGIVSSAAVFPSHGAAWREWLYGSRAVPYHTMSAFSYAFIVIGCLAYRYYHLGLEKEREAARVRLRAAQLDGQLSLAKMDTLRTQIDPHFLFNALNSIAALVETGRNTEAYRTIELLGGLLRSALDTSRRERVSLTEELAFVERYLEIEKIRFGEKLDFASDLAPDTTDLEVPALLLQPLVENAVKHAVATSDRPVAVRVRARRSGDVLRLQIEDDGRGFDARTLDRSRAGEGLRNVRERLALAYGAGGSLSFESVEPHGTRVDLELPAAPH